MGKIHKALEKSKKEQQQSKKDPFGSLKTQLKDRRRPVDIPTQDRDNISSQTTAESKLSAIHALLDDKAKVKTTRRDTRSFNRKYQSPGAIKADKHAPIPEKNNAIKPKREIDVGIRDSKKNEPPPPLKQKKDAGQYHETLVEVTKQKSQDIVEEKVFSLKSTQEREPTIQIIQNDGSVSQSEGNETLQNQVETGDFQKFHHSLVTLTKPKSFEAEQFKILRANLLFPKSGKPPRTILLTSAVPGEGKTFTAMNLAVSMAQNLNSHVLLVDADIRKPEIHKRFGLRDNISGLSDFLTQNIPIPSLLVKTPLPNLTILPGGQATINPSELISSEKMKKLLTELSTRYSDRFVIIDAPPPKLAAETFALSRFVEHIIPVVRSGRANRELVEGMIELLGRDKIQGVVFNCYDIRETKRLGYHKYSEYYSK